MQTRKDLYQAHRLTMQRVSLALLRGDPDLSESPTRRLTVSAFAGALVGILVVAGFGVWGLISPGGSGGLDKAGTLIIEKETGTKFVYSQQTKTMNPVANYTSARLILDTDKVDTKSVSQKSLDKYPRGPMVGILGAPDSLPDSKHQVQGPWSVCVHSAVTAKGTTTSYSSLVVGRGVGGRSLGDGEAVIVQDAGQPWVI